MKISFIAWEVLSRRSELLAQQLGADLHFVPHRRARRTIINAPIRYIAHAVETWRILGKEQPNIVFVQNPPIFCALIAFLYSRRNAAAYALDSHTGAFTSPKWRWLSGLHRMLSRHALVNIVHNESVAKFIKPWKCDYLVISLIPGDYPKDDDFPFARDFNVAVVNTFTADEPLETVFEAAEQLPDVDFYVTGDSKRITPWLLDKKPPNCHLTGFLEYPSYIALLRGADAVMDLTTRDHTVLMGGFEAIAIGTPLITSDWPVLVDCFSLGTVHVPNTAEGIRAGVREVQQNHQSLKQGILSLREKLDHEWSEGFARLKELLALPE